MAASAHRRSHSRYALLLASWLSHGTVQAQLHVVPEVSAQAAYDSNVFALSSKEQAIEELGNPHRSDTVFRYVAGARADYQWDIQKAYVAAEGRHLQYQRFDQLDHDEYLLSGGFNWLISDVLDGIVDYRQERAMAAFSDVQTVQLTMQRERKVGGTLNATVSPEWRLESEVRNHQLTLPLQGMPDYALSENSANAGIKYIGIDKLSAGLVLEYLRGSYHGGVTEDNFQQETAGFSAKYVVSGLSNLGADLGYTKRQGQAGSTESASGFTGALSYFRRISGATAVDAELFRDVDSFVAGTNAVVNTGARLGMFWQPTYKIVVVTRYEWSDSVFQGQGGVDSDRRDRYQSVFVNLSYQPLQWLSVKPFLRYQDRHSTIDINGFNECIAGFQLVLSFRNLIGSDNKLGASSAGVH